MRGEGDGVGWRESSWVRGLGREKELGDLPIYVIYRNGNANLQRSSLKRPRA